MKNILINKKGESSGPAVNMIVFYVLVIAGFAVIIFFIANLRFGKISDEELCHTSVLTRAIGKELLPLNCKTSYVCITQDGTCEGLSGKFETNKVKSSNEVFDILADEMETCSWMFGDRNINYLPGVIFDEFYCSLCYQTYLDDSLEKIFQEKSFDKKTFYEYLDSTKITDKNISYLQYLTDVKSFDEFFSEGYSKLDLGNVEFGKHYYTLTGGIAYNIFSRDSEEGPKAVFIQNWGNGKYSKMLNSDKISINNLINNCGNNTLMIQAISNDDHNLFFRYLENGVWAWTNDSCDSSIWNTESNTFISIQTGIINSLKQKGLEEGKTILLGKGALFPEEIIRFVGISAEPKFEKDREKYRFVTPFLAEANSEFFNSLECTSINTLA